MRHGYSVMVCKWGEPILTIEEECVSGCELSDEDEEAVRIASKHLSSFIGDGQHQCFVCGGIGECSNDCALNEPITAVEPTRENG